jgi:thymidylate kinase
VNVGELASAHRTLALDGCDGAGKTTLAHQLSTVHGFTVIHSARTPDGIDLTTRYRNLLATPGRLVLDRCFVSELVYGPLRQGRSRITLGQAIELTEVVAAQDGVLVHLTGRPSAIHARLLARDGDTAASASEVEALVTAYERVFAAITARLPSRVIRLDTADWSPGPG